MKEYTDSDLRAWSNSFCTEDQNPQKVSLCWQYMRIYLCPQFLVAGVHWARRWGLGVKSAVPTAALLSEAHFLVATPLEEEAGGSQPCSGSRSQPHRGHAGLHRLPGDPRYHQLGGGGWHTLCFGQEWCGNQRCSHQKVNAPPPRPAGILIVGAATGTGVLPLTVPFS